MKQFQLIAIKNYLDKKEINYTNKMDTLNKFVKNYSLTEPVEFDLDLIYYDTKNYLKHFTIDKRTKTVNKFRTHKMSHRLQHNVWSSEYWWNRIHGFEIIINVSQKKWNEERVRYI